MDQLRRIQNVLGKPSAEEIDKIPNAKARVYLHQQTSVKAPAIEQTLGVKVPKEAESMSRRAAAGRAELLANFFGGAVWGNSRENANCGDPPG